MATCNFIESLLSLGKIDIQGSSSKLGRCVSPLDRLSKAHFGHSSPTRRVRATNSSKIR
jgi:hypothetical protein